MSTTTFATATAGVTPPDPRKHVNYTQGMVLGVDDFTQEFSYLSNRDQWLAREAIGYGTLRGLQVTVITRDGELQVSVSPGVALSPRGELIRVAPSQCARLGAWLSLTSTQQKLADLNLTSADSITVYVVLAYRDCPTENLPVPGEPCRCDSETMAPSRIMDDFRLELTLTAPPQPEEEAVRAFVTWIRSIELTDLALGPADLALFLDALRLAAENAGSPPAFFHDSPPSGLLMPRQQLCTWMRAALRVWVTELRPKWQAEFAARAATAGACDCTCHGTGADLPDGGREGVLLAEVLLQRTGSVVIDATVDDSNRPFLVHLRALQELVLCGHHDAAGMQGPPGPQGDSVNIEFSVDGTAGSWHAVYDPLDLFMHVQVGNGAFSLPIPIVGTPGANGTNGTNGTNGAPGATGNSPAFVFFRLATPPPTPVGDAPVGWSTQPPGGAGLLWMSQGERTAAGTLVGVWSAPVRLTGDAGPAAGGFEVASGVVIFNGVAAAQTRFSPPIPHTFGDRLVMIRLALEIQGIASIVAENTDTIGNASLAHVIAGYAGNTPNFSIRLEDQRAATVGATVNYRVRWFAVPVTRVSADVIVPAGAQAPGITLNRETLLTSVAIGGTTLAVIGRQLGATTAAVRALATALAAENLVTLSGNTIRLN